MIQELDESVKEVIYNAMYDVQVEGDKEDQVFDLYKNDVEDEHLELLTDAIFYPDAELQSWFNFEYGQKRKITEVEKILKSMYLLDINQLKEIKTGIDNLINTKKGLELVGGI